MFRGSRALLLLVGVAILASPVLARASGGDDEADGEQSKSARKEQALKHFLRAQELYKLGRYREAIARLEAAVALDPQAPDLWYNLGVVHEKLGEADDAIVAYERYLKLLGPDADVEEVKRIRGFIERLRGAKTELKAREAKRMEHRFTPFSTTLLVSSGVSLAATGVFSYLAIHDDRAARNFTVGSGGTYAARQTLIDRSRAEAIFADVFGALTLVTGGVALTLYLSSEHPKSDDLPGAPPARAAWIGVSPLVGGGAVQLGMVF